MAIQRTLMTIRPERAVLIGFALSALAFFAFVDLAGEMLEGESRAFDEWAMLLLRSPADHSVPLGPAWFTEMMRDVTAMGSTIVLSLITIAAVMFLWLTRNRRAAMWVLGAVAGGIILGMALKYAFDRPRPDFILDSVRVYTSSFPSGHALMSAVVYLTLGALIAQTQQDARLRVYIIAFSVFLTLIVGISRVYLGVHWPTDVLGGWALGAAWATGCWTAMMWLQRYGAIEQARPIRVKDSS